MKRKPQTTCQHELNLLRDAGFSVTCYSDVHWRVWKGRNSRAVDIWPTSGKYMLISSGGGASFYDDIIETMEKIFSGEGFMDEEDKTSIERMSEFREWHTNKMIQYGLVKELSSNH